MAQDTEVFLGSLMLLSLPLLMFFLLKWGEKYIRRIVQSVVPSLPCKNPLVEDTKENRYYEWVCKRNGCVTTAAYYIGMPQATCLRCGGKNRCAQPQVSQWRLPDRLQLK